MPSLSVVLGTHAPYRCLTELTLAYHNMLFDHLYRYLTHLYLQNGTQATKHPIHSMLTEIGPRLSPTSGHCTCDGVARGSMGLQWSASSALSFALPATTRIQCLEWSSATPYRFANDLHLRKRCRRPRLLIDTAPWAGPLLLFVASTGLQRHVCIVRNPSSAFLTSTSSTYMYSTSTLSLEHENYYSHRQHRSGRRGHISGPL